MAASALSGNNNRNGSTSGAGGSNSSVGGTGGSRRIKARAVMHGAISIVNAIATGNGSALGISLKVVAEVELGRGHGVRFLTGKNDDLLVNNIIRNTLPREVIENNMITIRVRSEIPIGYGLKSSSAVSNSISLACCRLAMEAKRSGGKARREAGERGGEGKIDDFAALDAAVRASLDARVSITGAYDDATACYFGGFVVTDNYARKLVRREEAPGNLHAVIFLPRHTPRGDVRKLSALSDLFGDAFKLAEAGEYWKAMKLNGVLASAALGSRYQPIMAALEHGALGASISGNGPSVAAVAYEDEFEEIASALSKFDGRILTSKINNQKASVEIVASEGE